MTTEDAQKAVNYGAAHGALAMTTPGDTTMASKKEVEAIMKGVAFLEDGTVEVIKISFTIPSAFSVLKT